ncbi:MAG: prepilin-type N-terminal cleavage/methylation domain-containing protein [Phycisphaerales bacterium]|nr:prepilin-type N-terminal cleavage/methylation domain-containing protein [Phycisphaerales bacterium]
MTATKATNQTGLDGRWRLNRTVGFTLVELLVVLAIVALLLSILLPSFAAARGQAKSAACSSNVRQLVLANTMYGNEHADRFCPGAAQFIGNAKHPGNLHRWHGTRDKPGEPFDARRGPLVRYLGRDARIRACPAFTNVARGFEYGAGGFGYNNAFIGVALKRTMPNGYAMESDVVGALSSRVRTPADTLMFADSAFVTNRLIEYSFAEPRYHATMGFRADPSTHFRHGGHANVGWCDGHVDQRSLTFTWSSGLYPDHPGRHAIGWFGATDDNRLFDLD